MKTGGMDVFLLSSGIGKQNLSLYPDIELQTAATNVSGFIRMVNAAYHYFEQQGKGHIAVISSIAGTKGLGSAPAYSANQTVSKHLSGCFGPIGAHEQATHFLHRHPSRICRHPSVER